MTQETTPRYYLKAALIGLLFAMLAWAGESIVHYVRFDDTSFSAACFAQDPNEIWMRSVICFVLIAATLIIAKSLREKITLRHELFLAHTALSVMREGCVITDHANEIICVNPRYEEISGYQPHEVLGKNPNVLSSGKQNKSFYEHMWSALHAQGYWEGEIWNRHKSGALYPE